MNFLKYLLSRNLAGIPPDIIASAKNISAHVLENKVLCKKGVIEDCLIFKHLISFSLACARNF